MQLLKLLSTFIVSGALAVATKRPEFLPQTGGLRIDDWIEPLGIQYNFSDSQSVLPNYDHSFWSSSFLSGENGHQCLILSHVILVESSDFGVYRASILDITDPSYHAQFTTLTTSAQFYTNETGLNFDFGVYGLTSAAQESLGPINTYSINSTVEFNLTYEMSAPVILNGGSGTFQWEDPTIVNEWSMPAGQTTGYIRVNGTDVKVDPNQSFTWYDRQWQTASASNWTWFELHLNSDDYHPSRKLSIWFYPSGEGYTRGFATVQEKQGVQTVIPASFVESNRTWTSSATNYTYVQDWTVSLADGTELGISSIRGDQEIADSAAIFVTYEGYVTVTGTQTGFGLVEIQPYSS